MESIQVTPDQIDYSRIATNIYDAARSKPVFLDESQILTEYWEDGNELTAVEQENGIYLIYKDGVAMGYTDAAGIGIKTGPGKRGAAYYQAHPEADPSIAMAPPGASTDTGTGSPSVITSDPTRDYTEDFQSYEKARREAEAHQAAQAQRDAHDYESGGPAVSSIATNITSDPTRQYADDLQNYQRNQNSRQRGEAYYQVHPEASVAPPGASTDTGSGHMASSTIGQNPTSTLEAEFRNSVMPGIQSGEIRYGGMDVFIPSTAQIEFNGHPAELSSNLGNAVITYTDDSGAEVTHVFNPEDGSLIK